MLRKLRLKDDWITEPGLAILNGALLVNKSLELVELRATFSVDSQTQFDTKFHNELVCVPSLPLPHKLAIISAMMCANSNGRARRITERWIFEQICDFTGQQVQRKIV